MTFRILGRDCLRNFNIHSNDKLGFFYIYFLYIYVYVEPVNRLLLHLLVRIINIIYWCVIRLEFILI